MMTETTERAAACPVVIGQALYCSAHGLHWVAAIEADDSGTRLMIGGPSPMAPIRWRIVAVSSDAKRYTMDEHTAAKRAADGERFPDRSAEEVAELLARAEQEEETRRAASMRASADAAAARVVAERQLDEYRPSWAKAAIIAAARELVDSVEGDIFTDAEECEGQVEAVFEAAEGVRNAIADFEKGGAA